MQLFTPEKINATRKSQTRELVVKNERLVKSLRKVLDLQNDIEFDADKAKKVREYQVWCVDLQKKMSKELGNLKAYEKLTEDKKEEYYKVLEVKDALEDSIITLREELEKLKLQVEFKKQILNKQNA